MVVHVAVFHSVVLDMGVVQRDLSDLRYQARKMQNRPDYLHSLDNVPARHLRVSYPGTDYNGNSYLRLRIKSEMIESETKNLSSGILRREPCRCRFPFAVISSTASDPTAPSKSLHKMPSDVLSDSMIFSISTCPPVSRSFPADCRKSSVPVYSSRESGFQLLTFEPASYECAAGPKPI